MASDEQFSLCWNNFHANMSAGFHGLLSRGDLVDVTLAAEGRLLQAHKLVLSVCSPYFQEMFKLNPTQHPIVFLKDVSHSALRDLLQFMYQGEVNVKQEELASFISTAEQLQVKGLTGNQNEESSTPSKPKPTSRPGPRSSQQRQSVMTKLETDLDSKPSSTPVAVKRPNRPSIASNNSSSSQSGPAKRKCVDPLEAGPSGSAKDEFVTIPDEDENNAVAPKMEPEFVNESMWDDEDDGANNDETNFGEDDSNMEMTGFDGSTTGDGNITGGGEGGAVGDAQGSIKSLENLHINDVATEVEVENVSDDDVIEVLRDEVTIEILSDGEELELEKAKQVHQNKMVDSIVEKFHFTSLPSEKLQEVNQHNSIIDPLTNTESLASELLGLTLPRFDNIAPVHSTSNPADDEKSNLDDSDENHYINVTDLDQPDTWSKLVTGLDNLGCGDSDINKIDQEIGFTLSDYNKPEQKESREVGNNQSSNDSTAENLVIDDNIVVDNLPVDNVATDNVTVDNNAAVDNVTSNPPPVNSPVKDPDDLVPEDKTIDNFSK